MIAPDNASAAWPNGQAGFRRAASGFAAAAMVLCVSASSSARPPQSAEVARVVYVGAVPAGTDPRFAAFQQSLERLRSQAPSNFQLEYAIVPVSGLDNMSAHLGRILATKPRVIVTPTAATALLSVRHTRETSVVFSSAPDPVRAGIVESMRQPGRRTTGISQYDDLDAKRLELLRDAFPKIKRVGVLFDRSWVHDDRFDRTIVRPAASLGLSVVAFPADTVSELDAVMQSRAALGVDAWYIPRTYISFVAEQQTIAHIKRLNAPAIYTSEREVASGGLMAYVQDTAFAANALADLTLRVLRGEDAGSIPVQRPKRFTLAVRPRDEPGMPRIDPSVIRRADRVY